MVVFPPTLGGGISSPGAPTPDNGIWLTVILADSACLCLLTLLITLVVIWLRERDENRDRRGFPIDDISRRDHATET